MAVLPSTSVDWGGFKVRPDECALELVPGTDAFEFDREKIPEPPPKGGDLTLSI